MTPSLGRSRSPSPQTDSRRARASRRVATLTLVAAALAVGLLGGQPSPVAASEGRTDTATTTYTLDPAKGLIRVAVTLKVTNRTPSTSEPYSCTKYLFDDWFGAIPYASTCFRTTNYYLNSTTFWVENQASGVKATSGGSSLRAKLGKKSNGFTLVTVPIPNLFNGRSRTVRLDYVIRGGAPRTTSTVRVMRAYASFCVSANGPDSGSVAVRVPAGFAFDTSGGDLSSKVDGTTRTYRSGDLDDALSFFACFRGSNEAGYKTEQIAPIAGRTVTLMSWPEDRAWATAVRSGFTSGLKSLTELIDHPMAGTAPLVIKEAVTGNEYAGFYDSDTNTIIVGEDFDQPSLVEHELAHVWFNSTAFEDRWINEGSAEWAGRSASGQSACRRPASSGSAISLETWSFLTPRSTEAERLALDGQYDAACYVVSQVADAAGPTGMTDALGVLLDGRDPYAVDPNAMRSSKIAGWKDWLDAIDEYALVPAAASPTLASDLLKEYGVTNDQQLLARRTAARSAYRDLTDLVGDWVVPIAVRAPLTAWDFSSAEAAIMAADDAWVLTGESDQVLPGVDARRGPAAVAWASALTALDLVTATSVARAQLDAAIEVAAAARLAATPLDLVQQVGLIGTTIPTIDPAVVAIRDGDLEAATQVATAVRDAINEIRDAGQIRLGVLASLVAGILLVLAVFAWRASRSRRQLAHAAAAASSAASMTLPAPMVIAEPGDLVSGYSSDSGETASALTPSTAPVEHEQTDEIPPPADDPLP